MKINFFVDIYIKCVIIKLQVERKQTPGLQYIRNEMKIQSRHELYKEE